MAQDALTHLAALTRQLGDSLLRSLSRTGARSPWRDHEAWFAGQTGIHGRRAFADAVAQAVTCCCFGLWSSRDELRDTHAIAWLAAGAQPLVRDVLRLCSAPVALDRRDNALLHATRAIQQFLDSVGAGSLLLGGGEARSSADQAVYFYDRFLAAYDGTERRHRGVFYTPSPLVSFVVRGIDALLREEFQLPAGIADENMWPAEDGPGAVPGLGGEGPETRFYVRLLDPAMGTGAFLLEAAAVAHQRFRTLLVPRADHALAADVLWNDYVTRHLLPRLWGHELMLPPLLLAHVALAAWLATSGFRFERPAPLHFHLANTMHEPCAVDGVPDAAAAPFTVILGNPPFSGVSHNRQTWMRNLLRGRDPHTGEPVANYFSSCGAPLAERKHWLEDDYVKFLRYAHWQIERAGSGIVAYVTNHAYLDNATFRGLREQLAATFPRISIVDLHGCTRSGERPLDGQRDQSLFGIEQGVAVSFLRRPHASPPRPCVRHGELWGNRDSKLEALRRNTIESLALTELKPCAPYFFFVPKTQQRFPEYEAGFRLCDIMPRNSTAVVTARDSFVVAFDEMELRLRMREFADLRIPDKEIRRRYFRNSRSHSYPPGDTRGWRMSDARRRASQEAGATQCIRSCLYRPWDRRHILWADWMIDWPRANVMDHLAPGGNLALIARRQMPASQPCTYFWVADTIAIDGLIRSDNRGSESVFPLYEFVASSRARPDASCGDGSGPPAVWRPARPNLTADFVDQCAVRLGLAWTPDAAEEKAHDGLTPRDLFRYMYALFHAPSYRQRYAEQLRVDFPRVLIPRSCSLFRAMAGWGRQLIDLHLLSRDVGAASAIRLLPPGQSAHSLMVPRAYPRYSGGTIWLGPEIRFSPVPPAVWEFRVGSYQVCRKWLQDRRDRELPAGAVRQYARIVNAIDQTIGVMEEIDRQIAEHGGWERAFTARPATSLGS